MAISLVGVTFNDAVIQYKHIIESITCNADLMI